MTHRGQLIRRSGSGSKWHGVRCSCGWGGPRGGWHTQAGLRADWRKHIRELGGKPPGRDESLLAETPDVTPNVVDE